MSFYSKRTKPRGGPDGGDGGPGGDLILKASPGVKGFEHLKSIKQYVAGSGGPGGKNLKTGKRGKSLTLDLPVGTLVRNKKGQILKDLTHSEIKFCIKGGRGGRGMLFLKPVLIRPQDKFKKEKKARIKL